MYSNLDVFIVGVDRKCIQQSIKEIMLKIHKDLIIFWLREHGKRANRPCLKREVDAESEIKLIIEEDGVPCPTVIKKSVNSMKMMD